MRCQLLQDKRCQLKRGTDSILEEAEGRNYQKQKASRNCKGNQILLQQIPRTVIKLNNIVNWE